LDLNNSTNDIYSEELKYIPFTNRVNLILIFIVSIPAILAIYTLTDQGIINYSRFIILIAFSIINLTLNYFKKNTIAKILTVLSPFFCIFIFPALIGFYWTGFFLWFPYGIMVLGAISFYVFSYEKERKILNLMITFFILVTLFYDILLAKYAPHHLDLSFIYKGENLLAFFVAKVVLLSFLYSSLYAFKIMYYKKGKELIEVNSKLDSLNNKLKILNTDLEKIVEERTEKIKLQNKKIIEMTYINSHRVRACTARIVGLINLIDLSLYDQEKKYCYDKIKETTLDLDEITKEVSIRLDEEN